MTKLAQMITEMRKRCGKAIPGPYRIERVDFEHDEIAYEVCVPKQSLHVSFYESNCLDQRISAKHQAELYAYASTDISALLDALEMAVKFAEFVIDERGERSYIHGTDAERAKYFLQSLEAIAEKRVK